MPSAIETLGSNSELLLSLRYHAHHHLPGQCSEFAALLQVLSICSAKSPAKSLLKWVAFQLDALLFSSFMIAFSPCLHAWVCL